MADNRITKHRLKNHWAYSWWKYLLMTVIAVFGVNLAFSVTAYKPPEEKKLEVFMCSGWTDTEKLYADLWPQVLTFAPDQEELLVMNIDLTSDDPYVRMQYTTYIAAQQGDLLLLPKREAKQLAGEEAWTAFVDLTPYIENGTLNVEGLDLSVASYPGENGEKKPFGLPTDALYGLADYGVDPADSVLVATAFSGNEENVIKLMNLFMERFATEKPDYYDEWHKQRTSTSGSSSQIFN